jgi:hypothetical protein
MPMTNSIVWKKTIGKAIVTFTLTVDGNMCDTCIDNMMWTYITEISSSAKNRSLLERKERARKPEPESKEKDNGGQEQEEEAGEEQGEEQGENQGKEEHRKRRSRKETENTTQEIVKPPTKVEGITPERIRANSRKKKDPNNPSLSGGQALSIALEASQKLQGKRKPARRGLDLTKVKN